MLKIELKNILFRANHGVYAEEKEIGGTFEINAWIRYTTPQLVITDISQTIDYSEVFALIKKLMDNPEALLETVVTKIAKEIFGQFGLAQEVYISLSKVNPPLPIYSGSAGVSIQLSRSDIEQA